MTLLMTGATGFIGKHILDELSQDTHIVLLGNTKPNNSLKWFSSKDYLFSPSYLEENGIADIDTLLLCGSWIPKASKDANDIEKAYSNIHSTMSILRLKHQKLRKIYYISSLDVYQTSEDKCSESSCVSPTTMYGWSKLYCEKLVQAFCERQEVSCCILRLGHVYGEGEEVYKKIIPEVIRTALKNEPVTIYGDGNAVRSFIYVKDVAVAIVSALKKDNLPRVINIVGDEPITINKLAGIIIEESNSASQIIHTTTDTPNRNYYFDSSLMHQYLLEKTVPFRDGIRREITYMKGI